MFYIQGLVLKYTKLFHLASVFGVILEIASSAIDQRKSTTKRIAYICVKILPQKMKKISALLLLLILFQVSFAQQRKNPSPSAKPKLVVGIVVDQMRQEYFYKFQDRYTEGGFKRLMREGFMMTNGHYNYIPTYTGPGARFCLHRNDPGDPWHYRQRLVCQEARQNDLLCRGLDRSSGRRKY
jgi:hypothetical protein